jgi:hypothetical protein
MLHPFLTPLTSPFLCRTIWLAGWLAGWLAALADDRSLSRALPNTAARTHRECKSLITTRARRTLQTTLNWLILHGSAE